MRQYFLIPFALLIVISFISCASFQFNGSNEQKTVYYPNMKEVDGLYVVNFMNQRMSKIGIQILDRYKEPHYLDVESIKAFIQRDNGENEVVYLKGEGYVPNLWEGENFGNGATIYSIRKPWVKVEHKAKVHVWVPLHDGKMHEFNFDCIARDHIEY